MELFIDKHLEFLRSQYRLSMMVKNWKRMNMAKREIHLRNAAEFLGIFEG